MTPPDLQSIAAAKGPRPPTTWGTESTPLVVWVSPLSLAGMKPPPAPRNGKTTYNPRLCIGCKSSPPGCLYVIFEIYILRAFCCVGFPFLSCSVLRMLMERPHAIFQTVFLMIQIRLRIAVVYSCHSGGVELLCECGGGLIIDRGGWRTLEAFFCFLFKIQSDDSIR